MRSKFDVQGLGKVGHALGGVAGIAQTVETNAFISDVVSAASEYGASVMRTELDAMAADPGKGGVLNHVYEWGQAGSPAGRLFVVFKKGNGRSQTVSFAFRASKAPIPSLDEREAAGDILPVPEKIKARLSGKPYVFRQKAQFMEYGGRVTIRPRSATKLFIPFSRPINGRTYAFVDRAQVNFAGKKHRGMFHAAWKLAQATAGRETEQMIQRQVDDSTRTIEARLGKTGTKSLRVGFSQGQDYSRNRMKLVGKMANAQVKRAGRIE